MKSTNLLPYECQSYLELSALEEFRLPKVERLLAGVSIFQFKYDGIWALVQIKNHIATVYSKTGQCKHSFPVNTGDEITLIGEFMYGSQWSQHPERKGHIYVFDCVVSRGTHISAAAYRDRYRIAQGHTLELGPPFQPVSCYASANLPAVWSHILAEEKWEGVVIRGIEQPYDSTLVKLKRTVQDDFVILGFVEGKGKHAGRLGALQLGQFDPTVQDLVAVMECGGGFSDLERDWIWSMQDKFRGRVCIVEGKSRFDSGALRHPTFISMRDDKKPEQCVLKRQSS